MADAVIQSFGVLNYSGMLFNKGNTRVPFSTLIGGKAYTTNHCSFVVGQEYSTIGGAQPDISETASLTAPNSTYITRAQTENVTQMFHESVYISYGKQSNMGTLNGLNISGQTANPATELDFQVAARFRKIERDIEYTFIRGTYQKAARDNQANRTRGMVEAITSNIVDIDGKSLRLWHVAEALRAIYDSQAPLQNLVLWVDPTTMFQLNADAEQNETNIVPASREINGIAISTLITPLGSIGLFLGEFLPAGTALIFNPSVIYPVHQPVPGKGNFFMEELARTGAGAKYQIFGQLGLDHGPEWYHAKITGINTEFEAPKPGVRVYTVDPLAVAEVLPEVDEVTLDSPVYVGVATEALGVTYTGSPLSAATLAYQWQKATTKTGTYADITSSGTSATYTPVAADAEKYIRCVVTSSGTALGTKTSNAVKVNTPELATVTLNSPVVKGVATGALTVTYKGVPAGPTLAYQWQSSSTETGTFSDVANETSATYTPAEGDVGKFIRCVVTATGTALGVVASNAVEVGE